LLPIYPAQSYIGRLKGGRTHPWQLAVLIENKPVPYVVKLFSQKEVNAQAVTKEVIGTVLAQAFDLQTPAPAFIRISKAFKQTLSQDQRAEINGKDYRLPFATALLKPVAVFNPNLSSKDLNRYADADTLFAFDCLIWNVDRTLTKPNLLLSSETLHPIDHELSLSIPADYAARLTDYQWGYPAEQHIFYKRLKARKPADKKQLFGTFEEYLKRLNPALLYPYFQQLTELKHPIPEADFLINYLHFMKQNSVTFVSLLQSQIL
jgi:hypothetical protein